MTCLAYCLAGKVLRQELGGYQRRYNLLSSPRTTWQPKARLCLFSVSRSQPASVLAARCRRKRLISSGVICRLISFPVAASTLGKYINTRSSRNSL